MNEKGIKPKIFSKMNKQKGITLIALVITIIVLLILAGVAISTLTGNDSIINNAGTAVEKYNGVRLEVSYKISDKNFYFKG